MALQKIETTIPDAGGVLHRYIGETLPTGALVNLALEVADVAEGPIASLLRSLVGGEVPDSAMDAELNLGTANGLLGAVKLEGIFSRALARGGASLARRALQGIKRESGPAGYLDVGEPSGFDAAYSANLPELGRALRWVFEANILPFSGQSGPGGNAP